MSINVNDKNIGHATAYAYYKAGGGTMTEAEFTEFMADFGTASQTAVEAAQAALASKNAAQTAATTATNKASEATTAATTATTKAGEASTSASTATSAKDTAVSASQTATTKATEATTAAATAVSAKNDAVSANTAAQSAKTAAQTAQAGAETAAASVEASAAQIQTNADDISELKEDFATMESDGVVPSAEQILTDKGVTDSVPYHFRRTGGNGADRLYDQIVGGTVCWNQLCNGSSVTVTSGHKYVSKVSTTWTVGASTGSAITGLTSGSDMVIDLTAMFGSTIADYIYSLEQTTAGAGVAFFKSLFPNDYYPYNSGELVSVSGLSEHKMVGFNQWDEEWEIGGIVNADGQPFATNDRIRSKNFCKCVPSTTYYCCYVGKSYLVIYWYDSDKNYISYENISNTTRTSPQNAGYFKLVTADDTTYKNDICINISDPAKNGTYEPYKAHSYPLDSSLTLRGVTKLVDGKLAFDGDVYLPSGEVQRRYGYKRFTNDEPPTIVYSVTVGTDKTRVVCNGDALPNAKAGYYLGFTSNAFVHGVSSDPNVGVGSINNGNLIFGAPTTVTTKEEAVAYLANLNAEFVYELATPTTETADGYEQYQRCDPSGTEEFVTDSIVPVGHNSFYPENLRAKVEGLPWNFASLIAPTESTFTATRNYTTGALFIVQNVLYKATSNIANGGTITPNTNCTATTLAEIISALA